MLGSNDIFVRGVRISIDLIPEEVLYEFADVDTKDESLEAKRVAWLLSVNYLTEVEFNLMVRRFFFKEALKTIRRWLGTGSTRTIVLREKRLKRVLARYIRYFLETDHEANMMELISTIHPQAELVVAELFKRIPKSRIYRAMKGEISRGRINSIIMGLKEMGRSDPDISLMCQIIFPED